ncbi:YqhV family protein [Cytobacillus spongiae]|uniref:YqhV family protein n=1 Tax=Cytobacillus spongiae TaxID=2901381 RepID=UPI001F39EDB3|nr:YqhV family protein [Cytobacillus spongiae]UII54391.1 YqhV family protein [Cytobacillus spongiae]
MFFQYLDKTIVGMALLRLLSGSIEIFVAYLFIKYNNVEKALIINSTLSIIGPIIFISTTTLGLVGVANSVSFEKIMWIMIGVGFILYGVKSG